MNTPDRPADRPQVEYKIPENEIRTAIVTYLARQGYDNIDAFSMVLDKPHGGKVYCLVKAWHPKQETHQPVVPISQAIDNSEPKFKVDDTVRLKAITNDAESLIRRFGQFWKVNPFAMGDCPKTGKKRYMITSHAKKDQGKFGGSAKGLYQMVLAVPDNQFKVIDVLRVGEGGLERLKDYKE